MFQVLGKRLKYSGCYWSKDVKTLEEGKNKRIRLNLHFNQTRY